MQTVDVLMDHMRIVISRQSRNPPSCVFLDTKFVSILSKNYTRFKNTPSKDSFVFTPNLIETINDTVPSAIEAQRFYMPFNLDRTHWIGLCVDCTNLSLIVLDCDISYRNDSLMSKELMPIAQLFPYLLKQVGRNMISKDLKTLTVERVRSVPQNPNHAHSGVTSVLLMQAHAVAGLEGCECLSTDVMVPEAKRLAVMLYEGNAGPL